MIFREILDVCLCDLGLMLSCVSMVSSERFLVGFPPLPLRVRGSHAFNEWIDILVRFPIEDTKHRRCAQSYAMKQRTKQLQMVRPISIIQINSGMVLSFEH